MLVGITTGLYVGLLVFVIFVLLAFMAFTLFYSRRVKGRFGR